MADDVLDVLATLAQVDAAVAVSPPDRPLLAEVGWPSLTQYALQPATAPQAFAAAAADGYDQAVLIAADAPDLPGMLIAKLLRPLTSKPVAAAPVVGSERGLLGLAAALPAPAWLPEAGLDELTLAELRRAAPHPVDVASATGWHRLRGPEDLLRLDPRLEGWESTRHELSGPD
jgi:hypothetical protein